jgi:hypothetical protein
LAAGGGVIGGGGSGGGGAGGGGGISRSATVSGGGGGGALNETGHSDHATCSAIDATSATTSAGRTCHCDLEIDCEA